jgi:hypothetical protein
LYAVARPERRHADRPSARAPRSWRAISHSSSRPALILSDREDFQLGAGCFFALLITLIIWLYNVYSRVSAAAPCVPVAGAPATAAATTTNEATNSHESRSNAAPMKPNWRPDAATARGR